MKEELPNSSGKLSETKREGDIHGELGAQRKRISAGEKWQKLTTGYFQDQEQKLEDFAHTLDAAGISSEEIAVFTGIQIKTETDEKSLKKPVFYLSQPPVDKAAISEPVEAKKSTREKVKDFRNAGFTAAQIADELEISPRTVENYVNRLLYSKEVARRIDSTNAESNKEKVKQLRNQNFTNSRIAEELGISPNTVTKYASQLIHSGEIVSRRKKGGSGRDQVKALRNLGYTNLQIAEKLNTSYATVATQASELIQSGEITPHKKGPKKKKQK